jgi:hypothetical protein
MLFALACQPDQPERFPAKHHPEHEHKLGYSITFPAKSTGARHVESTPFGEIEWFSRACMPSGRLDQVYLAEVGTLPPGESGGANQEQILQTLKNWISTRYPGEISPLDEASGPGYRYSTKSQTRYKRGIIVLRRCRLHHANATSSDANSPQVKKFLNSFQVEP